MKKLWSMTSAGGANNLGTIFQINLDGSDYTRVHDFSGSDGSNPQGSLFQASDGKLYGMTSGGGSLGFGVLFSIDPIRLIYTKLIDFTGTADLTYAGANPAGSLIEINNILYGMTYAGGANNMGVLFSFDPATKEYTRLLPNDFNGTNGCTPRGSLLLASDGKLYGMTKRGGSSYQNTVHDGAGIMFSFDLTSNTYSIVFDFFNHAEFPDGSLIQLNNGKLYGMTELGGISNGGTLFSFDIVTQDYRVLYNFNYIANNGHPIDGGAQPNGDLLKVIVGGETKLFGMASRSGGTDDGTIFSYDVSNHTLTQILNFSGTNGETPYGSLMKASNSMLYGLVSGGGTYDQGILFSLDPNSGAYTILRNLNAASPVLDGISPVLSNFIEVSTKQWTLLGDETGLPQEAFCVRTAVWPDSNGNNVVYMATTEKVNDGYAKIIVRKWNGNHWHVIGGGPVDHNFSRGVNGNGIWISIAVKSDATVFVAYGAYQSPFTVKMLYPESGAVWSDNLMNLSIDSVDEPTIVVHNNDDPYIALNDVNPATAQRIPTVLKFNSSTNTWDRTVLSDSESDYINIALSSSGDPFVIYTIVPFLKARVAFLNSSVWEEIDNSTIPDIQANFACIALDNSNKPIIVFQRSVETAIIQCLTFTAGLWQPIANPGSSGIPNTPPVTLTDWIALTVDSRGNPIIAYSDLNNSELVTVIKYDGSSWMLLGTIAQEWSSGIGLVSAPGNNIYAAFITNGNGNNGGVAQIWEYA
jgi:uncharacterized repeat protein (TIGR03803 family)